MIRSHQRIRKSEHISTATRALLTLSVFFICATLGAGLALFTGWPVAILSGVVSFVCVQQVASSFARKRDKRSIAREMAHLRKSHLEFESALNQTSTRLNELDTLMEQQASAQEKQIVAEPKVLETLMRDFAGKISRSAAAVPHAAPRPQTGPASAYLGTMGGKGELLETIRASLEQNRVDLYLQPIVSLPQRKLRYMPAQYMQVAGQAGLMSVVDNLLLFRCVQIVRRLTQKSRDIGIFCNISGDTLADREFFPQFLDYMRVNRDLAGHIIFEFSQDAVRRAGVEGEKNLTALATIGFALSMDHVDHLGLDFLRLKAIGFRHLKIRAGAMLQGLSGTGSAVAAEDFKKLLTRHGLNLIAERVEDEKTVVQLLDYAVDYAQGYLFGEPRAVREDQIRPVGAAEPAPVIPLRRAG